MAIFNKSNSTYKSTSPDASTTIITAGSKIKGDMQLTCNLYVDGKFEGSINSQNEINIGKEGFISGDITAKKVIIQGHVEGTINADSVEIKTNGKVCGTVESQEFIIESKGIFEGNSLIKEMDKPQILSKPTSKD